MFNKENELSLQGRLSGMFISEEDLLPHTQNLAKNHPAPTRGCRAPFCSPAGTGGWSWLDGREAKAEMEMEQRRRKQLASLQKSEHQR